MKSIAAAFILICSVGYAHAADSKPFSTKIFTDVASPCAVEFDNPRLAMAWIQVVEGTLSSEQYIAISHGIPGVSVMSDDDIKKMVKSCVTGDGA